MSKAKKQKHKKRIKELEKRVQELEHRIVMLECRPIVPPLPNPTPWPLKPTPIWEQPGITMLLDTITVSDTGPCIQKRYIVSGWSDES
jgi:hypothetical protein